MPRTLGEEQMIDMAFSARWKVKTFGPSHRLYALKKTTSGTILFDVPVTGAHACGNV